MQEHVKAERGRGVTFVAAWMTGATLLLGGCAVWPRSGEPTGGSPEAWAAISNGAPIRVAVFTGNGARSSGMFRWLQLMELSPDVRMTPVDGEMVRAGALRDADVLVMPGGRATLEAVDLRTNGVEEVRAFIHRGGSYVGTCAGCFFLLQYARDTCLCPVLPYMFWRDRGDPKSPRGPYLRDGFRPIAFNARAKELIGVSGVRDIGYYGGPVMMPSGEPVDDAAFETLACFTPDAKQKTAKGVKFEKCAACVAGRYGRGRVVAFSVHPEKTPATSDILQGTFRYLTGRAIRLPEPERGGERLNVRLYAGASFGYATATWSLRLLHEPQLDVLPASTDDISDGRLRPKDVLVVPDVPVPSDYWKKQNLKRMKDFLGRGGRVVTWGKCARLPAFRAEHKRIFRVADAEAALALLRRLAASSRP